MSEENKKDEDKDNNNTDLSQVTEALKGLPEGVQNAVRDALREASGEQRSAQAAAAKAASEKEDDPPDEDVDVERLSRVDLVKHMDDRLARTLAKALKPIQEKLEVTSTDAETDRVKREFAGAKDKFSDFMDWKDEMVEIVTAHPDLSAEKIYLLAKAMNPDKAKELDGKVKDGKDKEDKKEASERARAFGGLTPTSGTSLEKDGKKQPKEAALSAWDQTMGQVDEKILGQALEG